MFLIPAAMPNATIGSATVVNHCPKPIYYHVSGFKNGQAWDGETKLIPANGFTMPYDTSVSIKLFHDPAQVQGSISQLEFNLETATGRIWYDISNVDAFRAGAPPFMEGGMHLTTHGEKHGNCKPVHCQKGQLICQDVYNLSNDDMTFACPQATNLHLVLCPDEQAGLSQPPAVVSLEPPTGGRPEKRPASATRRPVKVRDVGEDEDKPDSVMIGGLTWQVSGSSKGGAGKLPLLGVVAGVACHFISML